tara:strand:- start:774 stop:1298 length:525 start_codon:yes stop_codon:yes gene_type:complete
MERFVKGETVEFMISNKWRPVKVISINNLILKGSKVYKMRDEHFERVSWDFYIVVERTKKQQIKRYNVLQTSNRLSSTGKHITEDTEYYDKMHEMMSNENKRLKKLRIRREKKTNPSRWRAAVHAIDIMNSKICGPTDTLSTRSHFATFVLPKGRKITKRNISTSNLKKAQLLK